MHRSPFQILPETPAIPFSSSLSKQTRFLDLTIDRSLSYDTAMAQVPTPPVSRDVSEVPEAQQKLLVTNPSTELVRSLDTLLERYLFLLDRHQELQADFGKRLSSGFFSLAQANYCCSPGRRYGADYYDERMKAIRKISLQPLPQDEDCSRGRPKSLSDRSFITGGRFLRTFNIQSQSTSCSHSPIRSGENEGSEQRQSNLDSTKQEQQPTSTERDTTVSEVAKSQPDANHTGTGTETKTKGSPARLEAKSSKRNRFRSSNPITWYGILVPQSLRIAQGCFTGAVEDLVPELASVTVEMRDVERKVIRLRREIAGIANDETKVKQNEAS